MTVTKEAFAEWMQYVLYHRYINVDGAHGAQCWDLFGHFCDFFGIARVNTYGGKWSGWAGALIDQYAVNGAAANFDLIGPENAAQLADTAVWGDSYAYYPATHVAQVVADAGGLLLCASQNSSASLWDNPYPGESTGPTIIQHLPKQGLIGYLRPRGGLQLSSSVIATAPAVEDEQGEEKMIVLATDGKSPQVWAGDYILRRPIWTPDTMHAAQWLAENKVLGPLYKNGEVQTIPDLNAIGIDIMALVGKDVSGK